MKNNMNKIGVLVLIGLFLVFYLVTTYLLDRRNLTKIVPEKEEIIANVKDLGPYIVLTEDIALPHARPEQGVLESQLAVTLFKKPVTFNEDYPATKLFVALAAGDGEKHLSALASLMELFQDDERVLAILDAEDQESLFRYFN